MFRLDKKYFVATPRWYSYGGMFESLLTALNLAKYYDRKLVVLYPDVHFDSRYNYSAFLNPELKYLECKDIKDFYGCGSRISRILTAWINLSRRVRRTLFGRALVKLKIGEKLFPLWIGYSGLNSGRGVQKLLGLSRPVAWEQVHADPVNVDLSADQEARAEKVREKLGLPLEAPFVCLYVRDPGFEKLRTSQVTGVYNADINVFEEAVRALTDKGYFVVRMGDPTMKPASFGEKFIDYVHTPHYSGLMDLYLYRHCAFWLGTEGGGRYAPSLYNKASILVNAVVVPCGGYCIGKKDAVIFKHVFSVKEKRFLSLQEQFARFAGLPPVETHSTEYVHVENTPEEISSVVEEWLASITDPAFDWDVFLQEQYYNLRQKHVKEVFLNSATNEWNSFTVEQFQHARPKVGRNFLGKCWEYGDYLEEMTNRYRQSGSIIREESCGTRV